MFKPVHYSLEGFPWKGVVYEDNLSFNKTEAVFEYFCDELKNFIDPQFLAVNMTLIIQFIYQHIGVHIKSSVYIYFINDIMERINASYEASNGYMAITIESLKHKGKSS